MTIVIDGTTGISGVDGTAANPAIKGNDSNTGISYGTDIVTINTNGVARVTTDASGNVGFKTTSPVSAVDVNGPSGVTSFTGTTRLGLTVRGSTDPTDYSGIDFIGYGSVISNPTARIAVLTTGGGSYIQFGTSNAYASGITNTAVSIDPSGNLLVGTTAAGLSGYTGVVASGGAGIGTALNASRNDVAANASAGVITVYTNFSTTQEKFIVRSNGDVQNRTGSYTAYSDERLKENITDARSYLDDILKLRVVNYFFKNDTIKTKYLGFVAQEVEQVMPGLVFETETDGLADCKGVKLTVLIPMLVQSIQELKAEFDAYKAAHP